MPIKYTDQEKTDAVRLLYELTRDGSIELDHDVIVENVRDLCEVLSVSSSTLYRWVKIFPMDKEDTESKTKKKSKAKHGKKETKPKPLILDPEEINFVDGDQDGKLIVRSEQRFYGFLASLFGIKSYGSLPLNQLKLKIGLRLIKESGLVPTIGDK